MEKSSPAGKRSLGVFTLAMMNLAVICTLRGLPLMAEEGFSLIFYYLATILIFLIPVSLISAELATGWPPHGPGGVYIWVREAFGDRLGTSECGWSEEPGSRGPSSPWWSVSFLLPS